MRGYAGKSQRNAGFVLVSVLWILAILSVISLGFARRAMLERRMAWYALDREQARQMARAAAQRGLFEIRHLGAVTSYDGQGNYTGLDQRWARGIDLVAEGYFSDAAPEDFMEDVCRVTIEDEDRRIALNYVSRRQLEALKLLSGSTIRAIVDRREMSTRGYQDALFVSVDELREMQSFTEEQWYGTPEKAGLRDLICTDGDMYHGNVNINTASAAVLEALPDADKEVVEAIMAYRNGPDGQPYTADDKAFVNIPQVARKIDTSAEKLAFVNSYCKTYSRSFKITGHASRRRGKVNAFCTITVRLAGNQTVIMSWREDAGGA
jgi:DNA uptake protein ComE-like DNA-binding protein